MKTIAIVGSRRRTDRARVNMLVSKLHMTYGYLTIVSGGAPGPDTWAVETAKALGIRTEVYRPDLATVQPISEKWQISRAYHERNQRLAAACDEMYAFPAADRRGGTENAIAHARKAGKPVTVVLSDGTFQRG